MVQCIEFHGRLGRTEGSPPAAGRYDLLFRLHPSSEATEVLWEEFHSEVEVRSNGQYQVLLGQTSPLDLNFFVPNSPFVAVFLQKNGVVGPELAERTVLTGTELRLAAELTAVELQFRALVGRLRRRVKSLHQRILAIETGSGPIRTLSEQLAALDSRLGKLDGEDGRLERVEDELADVVGADGDLIDLYERVERLEGQGPSPRRMEAEDSPRSADLHRRISTLEGRVQESITADSLQVVKRSGDTMSGGLTINRGGLHVPSGGVHCRGAEVNTLEATLQVKTPKLIVDAVELRGDLTVDNTQRSLQIRNVEGRSGGSRKDGALHLNGRSGAEVVVGKAEGADGLRVFGPLKAEMLVLKGRGQAESFEATEPLEAGEVVVMGPEGKVQRSNLAADPRVIGVVTQGAALQLGGTAENVLVQTQGVGRCKVEGPVAVGDLLTTSSSSGRARKLEAGATAGAVFAKCLGVADRKGEVQVLLGSW